MSPLTLVGILFLSSSISANVKHVLDGSAQPLESYAASPEAVNQLTSNLPSSQYWWMASDSPLKAAYDFYKKCSTKNNCLPNENPSTSLPPPPDTVNINVKKNPFLNGNFQPGNANYNDKSSKIDISKNPFLSKSVVTAGNGASVVKDQEGFLGVQPTTPFGKKPGFDTTHPLEQKKKPGFATKHPLEQPSKHNLHKDFLNVTVECSDDGFACVEKKLCLNGIVNKNGEGLLQVRSHARYCQEESEVCCKLKNGKGTVSGSSIKFAGGAGFSPGIIHVQPLNVQPDIIFAGEHGHHSSSTAKSIRDTSSGQNSVFSSTVDYSDTKFDSDVRFASTFQGPAYLPPVAPTTAPSRQPSVNQQYVPSRPSTPQYNTPPAPSPTVRPLPSTSKEYLPPRGSTPAPQQPYQPSTLRPYQPSITSQQPSTQRPYQPSVAPQQPSTQRPYQPSVAPQQPYQPSTQRPYQPSTQRPYQPSITSQQPSTQRPYQPSITPQQPYQPSTQRPYQPSTQRPYQPSITPQQPSTQRPYQPSVTSQQPYQPSTQRPYQPSVTPQQPYQPSTQKPYQPQQTYQPSTQRPYQPNVTPQKPYQPSATPQQSYQSSVTPQRPYQPQQPTTSREYLPPKPSTFVPAQTTPRPSYQPAPSPSQPQPQPHPRPTSPPFRPTPSIPKFPQTPAPPSPQYPQPSTSQRPQYPQRPFVPPQPTAAPNPAGGYEYPQPTPTFSYSSTSPRPVFGNSNVNNQYIPPPQKPKKPTDQDQSYEAANVDGAFVRPTTPRTQSQFQGELNTAPPPGCAAALKCVQEIYCTAEGVISPVPVVLTKEQELSRVPTTVCQDVESGIIGKCCRDPNYKDPWPSANLVNGVDDGQYKEDDSIGQYQPDLQRNVRSDKPSKEPQCGVRHPNGNPKGPGPIDANFAEITWQAMILRDSNRSLLCGGAIIRQDAVLTTAHCIEGLDTSDILIKGGEWKLGIDEEPLPFQIVKVAAKILHPQYQRGSLINDLAVLILEEKLRPSKNIGTICLPPPNQITTNNCIATGWGKKILQLHARGAIMHAINVKVMDSQQCQQTLTTTFPHVAESYSPNTLCGYSNIDQCRVDHGSALACTDDGKKYTLSGIFSWDTGCKQEGQIGGYIAPDVEWITSILSTPINQLKRRN